MIHLDHELGSATGMVPQTRQGQMAFESPAWRTIRYGRVMGDVLPYVPSYCHQSAMSHDMLEFHQDPAEGCKLGSKGPRCVQILGSLKLSQRPDLAVAVLSERNTIQAFPLSRCVRRSEANGCFVRVAYVLFDAVQAACAYLNLVHCELF